MKKVLAIFSLVTMLFNYCSLSTNQDSDEIVEWGRDTTSTTERLEENNIDYEIEGGYIYIQHKDLSKAVACCT